VPASLSSTRALFNSAVDSTVPMQSFDRPASEFDHRALMSTNGISNSVRGSMIADDCC